MRPTDRNADRWPSDPDDIDWEEVDRAFGLVAPQPCDLPGKAAEELINGSARARDGCFEMSQKRVLGARERSTENDQRLRARALEIERLLSRTADGDAFAALTAVRELRQLSSHLEIEAVIAARRFGWSWRDVADALGVSAQTVHARHGPDDPRRRKQR